MSLLALIVLVAAIFLSGWRGIALWVGCTIVLAALFRATYHPLFSFEGFGNPIFLCGIGINIISILLGRWKGLFLNIGATIIWCCIVFVVATLGL